MAKEMKGEKEGMEQDVLKRQQQHHKHLNGQLWLTSSLLLNLAFILAIAFSPFLQSVLDEVGFSNATATATPTVAERTSHSCSGHGYFKYERESRHGTCVCNACFQGSHCSQVQANCVINLDHGDPKMYELHWARREESDVTIPGGEKMSYFATLDNFYFVGKELEDEIRQLHKVVGNAVTEGRYMLLGTGSTQLIQAALYALAPADGPPVSVVSQVPYYSNYYSMTTFLKSGLYKWEGDAGKFVAESEGEPFIELVASPNNPDGRVREHQSVRGGNGKVIYDLAYLWPQYTPITAPLDHDIMLFTMSKATGHAGSRLGWAIVKDEAVARRMADFVVVNSLGVSQDAQTRATQLLRVVLTRVGRSLPLEVQTWQGMEEEGFLQQELFQYGSSVLEFEWRMLREGLRDSKRFRLPQFEPAYCTFFRRTRSLTPAFVWVECLAEEDCEQVLRQGKIIGRSGRLFGADAKFVRVSMVDRTDLFQLFLDRMVSLSKQLD